MRKYVRYTRNLITFIFHQNRLFGETILYKTYHDFINKIIPKIIISNV